MLRGFAAILMCSVAVSAVAEPQFAIETGYSCAMCHVNPTGAGLRSPLGNVYAQTQMPARAGDSSWTGVVGQRFGVGANARVAARQLEVDERDDNLNFAVDRVALYLAAHVNAWTAIYIDQQVAPGGSFNREAWLKLAKGGWYGKIGKMFLPYGWRIEDDTAFIRSATGINLQSGDNGVEVGFQNQAFNVQLAASNGRGGGTEVDDGKQVNLRGEWLQPRFRLGANVSSNRTDFGDRAMYGLFAGLKTGFVHWLLEYDRIEDSDSTEPDLAQDLGFIEANLLVRQGHNLKLTAEARGFDDDQDSRLRFSAIYEYTPFAFTQVRGGVRLSRSDDDQPLNDGEEFFVQLHGFF